MAELFQCRVYINNHTIITIIIFIIYYLNRAIIKACFTAIYVHIYSVLEHLFHRNLNNLLRQ